MFLRELKSFILSNRNVGKRNTFQLNEEGIDAYIQWAFQRDFLFVVYQNDKISGAGISYVIPNKCKGNILDILPYDQDIENETTKDICIMDWIALNPEARNQLMDKFCLRFPNWENQDKWGIHNGKIKLFPNRYVKNLKLI